MGKIKLSAWRDSVALRVAVIGAIALALSLPGASCMRRAHRHPPGQRHEPAPRHQPSHRPEKAAVETGCGVDVHLHLNNAKSPSIYPRYAKNLVELMDELGIKAAIIMPPPTAGDESGAHYEYDTLRQAAASQPGRIFLSGGGGDLNSAIHASHISGRQPTAAELEAFERKAQAIADGGVAGFGEFAVLHLSYKPSHPFISAPADHPMFLRLVDVAARNNLPVDIHLELVSHPMPIPKIFKSASKNNPPTLEENQSGFERLLAHNRGAKIVWTHVGWDNTGHMTAAVVRGLLARHPNLYLALKMLDKPGPVQYMENRPLDENGNLRGDWGALIADYPDRVLLGADEFVGMEGIVGSPSARGTWSILEKLPPATARRISCENPARIYRLR